MQMTSEGSTGRAACWISGFDEACCDAAKRDANIPTRGPVREGPINNEYVFDTGCDFVQVKPGRLRLRREVLFKPVSFVPLICT